MVRRKIRLPASVCAVCLLFGGVSVRSQAGMPQSSLWVSDPTLASQLADKTTLGSVGSIQAPKNYVLQVVNSGDGVGTVYHWTGAAGVKGYKPILDAIVAKPPPDSGPSTIDQVMATLVSGFHNNKQNWKLSSVSVGSINGLSFHRVDWSGLVQAQKLNIQGTVLGTELSNGTFVIFSIEDAEPDSTTNNPVLAASVMTFAQGS